MSAFSFDPPQPSMWPTSLHNHLNEHEPLAEQTFPLIENVYQGHLNVAAESQWTYNTEQPSNLCYGRQIQSESPDFSNYYSPSPSSFSRTSSLRSWSGSESSASYYGVNVTITPVLPEQNHLLHNHTSYYDDSYLNDDLFFSNCSPSPSSLSRTPSLNSWSGSESPSSYYGAAITPEPTTEQNCLLHNHPSFYDDPYPNDDVVVIAELYSRYPTIEFDAFRDTNTYPVDPMESQTYKRSGPWDQPIQHIGAVYHSQLEPIPNLQYPLIDFFPQSTNGAHADGGAAVPPMPNAAFPDPLSHRPPSSIHQSNQFQLEPSYGPGVGIECDDLVVRDLQPSVGPLPHGSAAAMTRKYSPYGTGANHSISGETKLHRQILEQADSLIDTPDVRGTSVAPYRQGSESGRFYPPTGEKKTTENIVFGQVDNRRYPSSGIGLVERGVNPDTTHGRRSRPSHRSDLVRGQGDDKRSDLEICRAGMATTEKTSVQESARNAQGEVGYKKKGDQKQRNKIIKEKKPLRPVGQGARTDLRLAKSQGGTAGKDTSAPDQSENQHSPMPIFRPGSMTRTETTLSSSNLTSPQ